ncbi:class I SAM-dependent methyltransferase [Radiobacillus kanasensis]|uniref:class I SAM-dependent methyltransferase n=1 Tax=Radiobacillus kanasensis TaxID=2844358 RepID=UPI001E4180CC|nr:class I SAM-dependent methyltransferase [Radiobacillus kanasensis]UFT99952.1 class I SAM-dependent methyltransferase [Radiobacillus kanasensis]
MEKRKHDSISMNHFTKKVEYLDNPEKRGDIPPKQLLSMLPIQKDHHILDFGAGTGYYTIPAAQFVSGQVYAVDKDPKMLEVINSKANEESIKNVTTLLGSMDDLSLAPHSIDFVLASLVLHEVENLPNTLLQIKKLLKPGGYLACIEIEKKDESSTHPRIASSTLEQELFNVGFKHVEMLYPTDQIYIAIAKKE